MPAPGEREPQRWSNSTRLHLAQLSSHQGHSSESRVVLSSHTVGARKNGLLVSGSALPSICMMPMKRFTRFCFWNITHRTMKARFSVAY